MKRFMSSRSHQDYDFKEDYGRVAEFDGKITNLGNLELD